MEPHLALLVDDGLELLLEEQCPLNVVQRGVVVVVIKGEGERLVRVAAAGPIKAWHPGEFGAWALLGKSFGRRHANHGPRAAHSRNPLRKRRCLVW